MTSLLLFSVFLLICSASSLKGVSPKDFPRYQMDKFICGNKQLPTSVINDDYCDCADGSDEPGTSACSNGRFWCQNKGAVGNYIPSSHVDDLICDCCDGSDEVSGCRDTCREIAEASNKETRRKIEHQKIGMQLSQMKAREYLRRVEEEKTKLIEATHKKDEVDATSQVDETKKRDSEDLLQRAKERVENQFKTEIDNELQEWVRSKILEKEKKREEQEEQEGVLDQGDKEIENSNPNEEETPDKDEIVTVTEGEKTEQLNVIKEIYYKKDSVYTEVNQLIEKLTDTINELKKKSDGYQEDINRANEFLKKDTGPQNRFSYMIDEKYEVSKDQYTYYVQPFQHASQSHTSVGNWKGFSEDYTKMFFDKGQSCWGGPDRSLEINMVCGETTRLTDVREESKCTYIMSMETPGACNEEDLKKLEASLL